jgi:hypothetical protein
MRVLSAIVLFAAVGCSADDRAPNVLPTDGAAHRSTQRDEPVLLARALYPATLYQPGPTSGTFITPDNGITPPFNGQPIPGFSAVLDAGDGTFWAMPDNGYGAKNNSGDFLLRLYRVRPDFKTAAGGSGVINVVSFVQLRDPDGKIPFALFRGDRLLTPPRACSDTHAHSGGTACLLPLNSSPIWIGSYTSLRVSSSSRPSPRASPPTFSTSSGSRD